MPLQDGTIFDIRYECDRYTCGGECVEVQNVESYEEAPDIIGYCHLHPYQIRGVVYDVTDPNHPKGLAGALVYITNQDGSAICGPREIGACDEERCQVLSGLAAGERVVAPVPTGLKAGDRIVVAPAGAGK